MLLSMEEICKWAGTNPAQNNFKQAERLLNENHLIKCGKSCPNDGTCAVKVTALCLKTSNLKDLPHEIIVKIGGDGSILSVVCSCKAGAGEKCKHCVATLLHCYRNDIENFSDISCTDSKCSWKNHQKDVLQNYTSVPLAEHSCFMPNTRNTYTMSNELRDSMSFYILQHLPNSAFAKHVFGRHEPIKPNVNEQLIISEGEKQAIRQIFVNQNLRNTTMEYISQVDCGLQECCAKILEKLNGNFPEICERSRIFFPVWKEERQYRITGSTCYALYTYSENKNPDWDKKCAAHINVQTFKNEYVIHGLENEKYARDKFVEITKKHVVQTGLIVCEKNPWLAVSPDGVIFEDDKPVELLEIKCPFKGKTMTVEEAIKFEFKSCLATNKYGDLMLKEKHKYYGQVQLGMAILNVNKTAFVVYASYDQSIIIINVTYDESFTRNMLLSLKNVYYKFLIHAICIHISSSETNVDNEP